MRACFFGDSFTLGVGDEAGLGWVGRVVARMQGNLADLAAYNLGIRRDTSADILHRWQAEAEARLAPAHPHRLAFCFGANDCADDGAGQPRLSHAETMRNARDILTRALETAPPILIGPPPILDDRAADRRIAALEADLHKLADSCIVPFLPVFDILRRNPAWTSGAGAGDGTHPDAAGYDFLANVIWEWPIFQIWARP